MKNGQEVPSHERIIEIAKSISNLRDRALFIVAYLTAGRIEEILPKRYVQHQKKDRETKEIREWKEEVGYHGVKKSDIEFKPHKDRDFIVITMLNEKNRRTHLKQIPFPADKEKELVTMLKEYIDDLDNDKILFKMSRVTAWRRMKRLTGFNPHWFRHIRTTHLITIYKMSPPSVVKYLGWSDDRPLEIYSHLFWTDIADEM